MKRTPLKRTPLKRRPKRNALSPETRELVLRRDGYGCQGRYLVPHRCSGRIEIHHLRNRGMGGATADDNEPENLMAVCSWLNHWVAEHPAEAEAAGLYRRH